ncbi:PREDICTED: uncharacterized protein LOC104612187 [Nelumbo nucifera]|uniref:Uncharacterized protein LOC104612187 n=2 Tax=Nelumbo nucifera TaxID=4432 RepID=A0A1U8BKS4_NELNU|nr:PREDICTED: uncharacterized protein LOC104612187 [Nelumbo nucifera]DAD25100.1 TPA_asm: hypothetical protein HUJ06_026564 [Nelumbo nucifera]
MNRVSRFRKKGSSASETVDPSNDAKKKLSPRDPLKELNSFNSSDSSSTSLSIEAPRGCLRFLLSNSSSRTPLNRPKTLQKTPKSAPNPRPSNSKPRCKRPAKKQPSKSFSENPEKPISQNPQNAKRTPCLYQWQNGKKPGFRATQQLKPPPGLGSTGTPAKKSTSGPCLEEEPVQSQKKMQQQQQQQEQWSTGMFAYTGEPSERRLLSSEAGENENSTPVNKVASGLGLGSTPGKALEENSTTTTTTTTPPVQVSISPELQCGSSMVSTPACFAAGHVLSGVTDKRKCRARGILTVGEGLGFSKVRDFNGTDDDNALELVNNSRASLIPAPTEASMRWLLSPYDEEEDHKGTSPNGSPESRRLVDLRALYSPSSPSSGHRLSSDVCNNDYGNGTTATRSGRWRRGSFASKSDLPEFEGFVGPIPSVSQISPLSDNLVGFSSPCTGTIAATCGFKAAMPPEGRGYRYDHAAENSPFSWNSLGSGNMICTPQSGSSSDRRLGSSWLKAKDYQECQLELDSMVDALAATSLSPESCMTMRDPADVLPLPGLSFQFSHPSTPSSSIDHSKIWKPWNDWALGISSSSLSNASQSQMRISWRDGLVSRIYEMDELDCCRWSDEEEVNCCDNSRYNFNFSPELDQKERKDLLSTDACGSPEFVCEEPVIEGKSRLTLHPQIPSSCAESISTEGGGLVASEDSDWTLCYKNQLFQP